MRIAGTEKYAVESSGFGASRDATPGCGEPPR